MLLYYIIPQVPVQDWDQHYSKNSYGDLCCSVPGHKKILPEGNFWLPLTVDTKIICSVKQYCQGLISQYLYFDDVLLLLIVLYVYTL